MSNSPQAPREPRVKIMAIAMMTVLMVTAVGFRAYAAKQSAVSVSGSSLLAQAGKSPTPTAPTPKPTPTPNCEKGGTFYGYGEIAVPDCPEDPTKDSRACKEAVKDLNENSTKPTCASPCKLYKRTPPTIEYRWCSWNDFLDDWYDIVGGVLLFPVLELVEAGDALFAANPDQAECKVSRQWKCAKAKPAAQGKFNWVAW